MTLIFLTLWLITLWFISRHWLRRSRTTRSHPKPTWFGKDCWNSVSDEGAWQSVGLWQPGNENGLWLLINLIWAKALHQKHLLKVFLSDEFDAASFFFMLMFNSWVAGKSCLNLVILLPEIKTFLSTRNEEHKELPDDARLPDKT